MRVTSASCFKGLDHLFFNVVSTITAALLLWVGITLNANQSQIGQLQVEVSRLRSEFMCSIQENRELIKHVHEIDKDVTALKSRR